jgi:hypothetical protein
MIKNGDISDMELIRSYQAKLKTLSDVLDQYDQRIRMIAGETGYDPNFGEYVGIVQGQSSVDAENAYQEELAECKRILKQENGGKAPSQRQIESKVRRRMKDRAGNEYTALKNRAEAEEARLTPIITAKKREAQRRANQAEMKNMLKAALKAAGKTYAETRSLETRPRLDLLPMHNKYKFGKRIMNRPFESFR